MCMDGLMFGWMGGWMDGGFEGVMVERLSLLIMFCFAGGYDRVIKVWDLHSPFHPVSLTRKGIQIIEIYHSAVIKEFSACSLSAPCWLINMNFTVEKKMCTQVYTKQAPRVSPQFSTRQDSAEV